MMKCRKCQGRIWVEPERVTSKHYDLVCLSCGHRKMVNTFENEFGKFLRRLVLSKETTFYFWYDREHIGRRTLLEYSEKGWRIVFEKDVSDARQTVAG